MSAQRPIFLERQGYRRRRLLDMARLLPILGMILLAIPLLWPEPDPASAGFGEATPNGGVPTSRAIIYLFSSWAGLALASGLLVRRLSIADIDRFDGATPGSAPEPRPDYRIVLKEPGGDGA